MSLAEEWDQRAMGRSYYQLFAASLGNLEWLRFCLNRHRGEILADDKVRPWSAGAATEVFSTLQRAPHTVVTWQGVTLIHLPTVWRAILGKRDKGVGRGPWDSREHREEAKVIPRNPL